MHLSNLYLEKKDLTFGFLAGFLIGLLFLPVLNAAKPALFSQINLFIIPFFLIATPLGLAIANTLGKKMPIIWQIGKFGVTGILNALVDLGFLTLITLVLRNYFFIDSESIAIKFMPFITFYSLYKALSFIIANINSYYWNKHWTFQKNGSQKKSSFMQFFIVSLIGFITNVLAASLAFKLAAMSIHFNTDQAGLIGAVAGSVFGLAWNFMGYKFIVFKK
jgi:putative flippase GtrA